MERRDFNGKLLTTISGYALLSSLLSSQALAKAISPITNHWVTQLNEYCQDLKTNTISGKEWQSKVDLLYNRIELSEIVKFIDLDKLTQNFNFPDLGVTTKPVTFPNISDIPSNVIFVKKIFGMKKDRAIIPHGHSNMASAHFILKGEMHLRHYDKVAREENHLIIKPTIDKIVKPGDHSSISDDQDNIHWFVANSPTSFTFDIIMLDLNNKPYDIHNIDIDAKEDLHNGTLRVPELDVQTALNKYGKLNHH